MGRALLFVVCLGCVNESDAFSAPKEAVARANDLTSAFRFADAEVRDGRVVASDGPRLESYFAPLRILPDRPFEVDLTAGEGASATTLIIQVEDATSHLRVPVELSADGKATLEGLLVDASLVGRRHVAELFLTDAENIGNAVPTSLILREEPDEFDFRMRTLAAHARGEVEAVAFPNGGTSDILATGADDGIVTVWDLVSGRRRLAFSGHDSRIFAVCLTGDGEWLVSGAQDGRLRFWDAADGSLWREHAAHTDAVKAIALSPDDRATASGSWDGTVRLWETRTADPIRTIDVGARVSDIVFSSDGSRLVVATGRLTQPGFVAAFDVMGNELWRVPQPSDVTAIALDPMDRLAVAYGRGSVAVYDAAGVLVRELPDAPFDTIEDLGFPSRLPGVLMGLTLSGRMTFWDVDRGEVIAARRADNEMFAFELSRDGSRIGLGTGLGVAWIAEVEELGVVP